MTMSVSATLIKTDRFTVDWGEGDDSEPPPGLDFALALLDELRRKGARSNLNTIDEDCWEHTNWFFWVTWEKTEYTFTIQCSPSEDVPTLWLIEITKSIGIWKSILGRGRERQEIDPSFLKTVGECLEGITGVSHVGWIDSTVAFDQMFG